MQRNKKHSRKQQSVYEGIILLRFSRSIRLEYLNNLDQINQRMEKRNEDIDRMVALAMGDITPAAFNAQNKDAIEELERLRNEKDLVIKAKDSAIKDMHNENKALTEELEKARKYPYFYPLHKKGNRSSDFLQIKN